MSEHTPPRAAIALLRWAVGVTEPADGILGDLTEEFHERCERRGPRTAARWFWGQALRIAITFRIRGRSVRRRALASMTITPEWSGEVGHAARSLRRAPAFTALSITVLALGIGTATAVFAAFRSVALVELPVSDPDRIVTLSLHRDAESAAPFVPDEIDALGSESRTLRGVAGVLDGTGSMPLTEGDRPLVLDFAFVTAGFFDVLGARPALGRLFRPEDGAEGAEPVTVISYRTWQREFGGDPDVLGRRLTATQYQGSYSIVGVAPPGLDYPVGVEYWILPGPRRQALNVVARLAPNATPEVAESELLSIARAIDDERSSPVEPTRATVESLSEAVLGDARPILLAITAAAALLLLIACANVGSLLLMRAERRSRDVMVRRALGARSGRIARLFLLEGALLGAGGGVLGLVLALGLLQVLPGLVPTQLPRTEMIGLAAAPVAVVIAVTVLAVLLIGVLPSVATARGHPASGLQRVGRWASGPRGARSARRSLVAAQVALAVVVLFAAGLLGRTLQHLHGLQLGYETEGVALMELGIDRRNLERPAEVADMLEGVFERVRGLPGVTSVTPLMARPFTGDGGVLEIKPLVEGQTEAEAEANPSVPLESGGSELFRTLGIPILSGRSLRESDREDAANVAVISEALAARLWPGEDAVGKRIRMSLPRDEWWTIVGVAGDTRFRRLREPTPTIYLPWRQFQILPMAWTVAVRTEGDVSSLVPAMSRAIRDLDPRIYLWQAGSMSEHLGRGPLAGPRLSAALFSSFALAALILAAVGLYGVMALAVQEQTRDLGVRRALGAPSATLCRNVLLDALATTSAGAAIGLVIALAASQLLKPLLFEVTPGDPVTLAGVCAVLVGVSVAATYVPVRRATRVDPLVALRAD